LTFLEIKIDMAPFPVRTIDLNNTKVLIRLKQMLTAIILHFDHQLLRNKMRFCTMFHTYFIYF